METTQNAMNPNVTLGFVALRVQNLKRSLTFYTETIGFSVNNRSGSSSDLGAGNGTLLRLVEDPAARPAPRTAGLYHFAILVPSRRDLAWSLKRLVSLRTPLQGFADHLVSEAVYLADPDGNGIEIYRDLPRDQWPRRNGQLLMATDPLDVNSLLEEVDDRSEPWTGLAQGTTIGHIHLQVSSLEGAVRFYQNNLGFDLVMRYGPSAAFLSAGGYHHHIGLNTWAGAGLPAGLPAAPPGATGLIMYSIDFPDQTSYDRYIRSAGLASLSLQGSENGLLAHDPSGNGLLLRVVG